MENGETEYSIIANSHNLYVKVSWHFSIVSRLVCRDISCHSMLHGTSV